MGAKHRAFIAMSCSILLGLANLCTQNECLDHADQAALLHVHKAAHPKARTFSQDDPAPLGGGWPECHKPDRKTILTGTDVTATSDFCKKFAKYGPLDVNTVVSFP